MTLIIIVLIVGWLSTAAALLSSKLSNKNSYKWCAITFVVYFAVGLFLFVHEHNIKSAALVAEDLYRRQSINKKAFFLAHELREFQARYRADEDKMLEDERNERWSEHPSLENLDQKYADEFDKINKQKDLEYRNRYKHDVMEIKEQCDAILGRENIQNNNTPPKNSHELTRRFVIRGLEGDWRTIDIDGLADYLEERGEQVLVRK